jgi:hypothetical protein
MIATRSQRLGLVQVVRREQDGRPPRPQAPDHLEQLGRMRGRADGRLVQDRTCGLETSARDLEPAALAAAVAADGPVEELGELRRVGCSVPAVASAGSTRQRRACRSRFRRPLSARSTTGSWKTTLLARLAASGRGRRRTPRAVRSAGGRDRGREHPDRGRLAGAVGPDEAEDLAAPDVEVDPLDRLDSSG